MAAMDEKPPLGLKLHETAGVHKIRGWPIHGRYFSAKTSNGASGPKRCRAESLASVACRPATRPTIMIGENAAEKIAAEHGVGLNEFVGLGAD